MTYIAIFLAISSVAVVRQVFSMKQLTTKTQEIFFMYHIQTPLFYDLQSLVRNSSLLQKYYDKALESLHRPRGKLIGKSVYVKIYNFFHKAQ
jgi:hypothetical protein